MKYIQRNGTGEAISVYANLQAGYAEEVVSDDYIRPLTAEELAKEVEAQADSTVLTQAKADATIKYLVTHTPTEIEARIRGLVNADNVSSLATAKAALQASEDMHVRLAIAVAALGRKQLR